MKFSIRDLLLVTVIVALAVGWLVDRKQLSREKDGAQEDAAGQRWAITRLSGVLRELGYSVDVSQSGKKLEVSKTPANNPLKK